MFGLQVKSWQGAVAACALAAGAAATSLDALAAEFPTKEITVIVNYGAGGGTDLSTRVISAAAEDILGQPFRIENRTGGGGTVGPSFIANADADGYTIGIASFQPLAVVPHLREVPYGLDDFRFILGHARYRSGISVATGSPFMSIQDVIDAARAGQEITYASTSTQGQILIAHLARAAGTDNFRRVTYKSGREAVTAVMGGVVDLVLEGPTNVVPQIEYGTLRLLASASSVRWYEMPEVPTLQEEGFDVVSESYAGFAAPAGTPEEVIQILETALSDALGDPEVQKTLQDLGMEPVYFTSAEYEELLHDGFDAMATDLVTIGLKTE